jgi:DNA-binding transcriptional LysR family regulator
LELRQIDCFLAVATDLHFGKAAKRLCLAQSSISQAVNSLEEEVGGQLFVRTSRRVQLTPLGEKFRLGVEPAALVLRATLDDCRKTALGQANRLRIGFLGGGLYELTLPFVRHLRSKFHIDVEWVELSLLDQFEAVAVGKVDAAICRLPLSHDGLVQCTVLLEEKKKLVVPAGHRLSDRELIDPEELALETLPTLPDNHQLGAWAAIHFPDHTPVGTANRARASRNNDSRMSCGCRIRRGRCHRGCASGALLFQPAHQIYRDRCSSGGNRARQASS